MPSRRVTYRVIEKADGAFAVEITCSTGLRMQREGFRTRAELDAALDDLRVILAATGCQLMCERDRAVA